MEKEKQEETMMMILHDTSKLFGDRMREESLHVGVQEGFRSLLYHLARGGAQTQLALSKITHLRASTVSVALQNMERAGMVTRHADSGDLRQTIVTLTEKGTAMDRALAQNIDRLEQRAMDQIDEQDQQTLRRLLCQIRENLKESSNAAAYIPKKRGTVK